MFAKFQKGKIYGRLESELRNKNVSTTSGKKLERSLRIHQGSVKVKKAEIRATKTQDWKIGTWLYNMLCMKYQKNEI